MVTVLKVRLEVRLSAGDIADPWNASQEDSGDIIVNLGRDRCFPKAAEDTGRVAVGANMRASNESDKVRCRAMKVKQGNSGHPDAFLIDRLLSFPTIGVA